MKDLKYLAAFSIPIVAFIGLYFKGPLAYLTPVYAFVMILQELIVIVKGGDVFFCFRAKGPL